MGARWADGEGGRAGKISMSDFGKRRGESIILFAKKEFKPEGRGRGRGGVYYYFLFFLQGRGGGEYYCLGARWADGEGGRGGKISMSDFGKRRGESILLFAEKEFKPEGQGRGRGGGALLSFVFARRGGGSIIFLPRMKPLKGSRWVGGELSVGGGRVIIVISAS